MDWRIYYDDGSIFSSGEGEVKARDGVVVIAETDRSTFWQCHVYGEVYGWLDGHWHAAPEIKKRWPADVIVLSGKLVSDDLFRSIRQEAMRWLHPEA